jgi:hypothetical protein
MDCVTGGPPPAMMGNNDADLVDIRLRRRWAELREGSGPVSGNKFSLD